MSKKIYKDFMNPDNLSYKFLGMLNQHNKNKFSLIEQVNYVSSQTPMGLFLLTNSDKIKEAYHYNKNKVTQIKAAMLRHEHEFDKISCAAKQVKADFRLSSMQKYNLTRQQVAATVAWNSPKLKQKMLK
jgi:hypothetical protein